MGDLNDFYKKNKQNDEDCFCLICNEKFIEGEFWIQCNPCQSWYHGLCVNLKEHESSEIDKFHCNTCSKIHGSSIYKKIYNNHRYDRTLQNAESLPIQVGTSKFLEELKKRKFKEFEDVDVISGNDLDLIYLIKNGFKKPILIKEPSGLNMKIPEDFTMKMLIDYLGPDFPVEVINVYKQETNDMKLIELINALNDLSNRPYIYNCISLELSRTELSNNIEPPEIVNKMSWVDNCWEKDHDLKPTVSKYCLLSMEKSYTDFHIDFSGTSVWYHVLKGEKLFYFIAPTEKNIKAYENWMNKNTQNEIFFPDEIESECYSYLLKEGNTMFIPTGWIHGVYTPKDSIVFGGNFLNIFNVDLQIEIFKLEERLDTSDKFKFPCFELTHWLATKYTLKFLKDLVNKKIINYETYQKNKNINDLIEGLNKFNEFIIEIHKVKQNSKDPEDQEGLTIMSNMNSLKLIKKIKKLTDKIKSNQQKEISFTKSFDKKISLNRIELDKNQKNLIETPSKKSKLDYNYKEKIKHCQLKNTDVKPKTDTKNFKNNFEILRSSVKQLSSKKRDSFNYKPYSPNIKQARELPEEFQKILGTKASMSLNFKIPKKKAIDDNFETDWD